MSFVKVYLHAVESIRARIYGHCEHQATARSVLLALFEIANEERSAEFTIAQNEIACRAAVSRPTANKILHELREIGLVSFADNAGMRAQKTYCLAKDSDDSRSFRTALKTGDVVNSVNNVVKGKACANGSDPLQRIIEKKEEGITIAQSAIAQAEELYQIFPRKRDRKRALSAIKSALKKADFETLKKSVAAYAVERAGQEPRFTKLPATWFNGECWNNQPETEADAYHYTEGRD